MITSFDTVLLKFLNNIDTMVGTKIASIRESKEISIDTLAERSGLSVAQINQIEDSHVLPPLAPLIKIARVLGVRLGTFLDDNSHIGPTVTLKDETALGVNFSKNDNDSHSSMNYLSLAGRKSGRHMEPFIIEIASSERHKLSQHEGEEFIYILEGCVEIEYGTEKFELCEGDSIYYDSTVAHHVHAKGDAAAKILATVYSPV